MSNLASIKYIEPYSIKAKILAWSELNVNEIDMIFYVFKSHNLNEINLFLQRFLNLNPKSLKEKALMDMHYYAIKFALENNFNKIQMSSFISILRALHRANQETPFENYNFMIKYFEELMICHTIKRPPYCVDIFDSQKATMIIDYIKNSYLRHYKMYKFSFTPKVALDLKMNYVGRTPSPTELNDDEDYQDNNDVVIQTQADSGNENKTDSWEEDRPDLKKEMREYIRKVVEERIAQGDVRTDLENVVEEKLNLLRVDTQSRLSIAKPNKK